METALFFKIFNYTIRPRSANSSLRARSDYKIRSPTIFFFFNNKGLLEHSPSIHVYTIYDCFQAFPGGIWHLCYPLYVNDMN